MKTYVIDIDGTICTKNCELQGSDYTNSKPIRRRIDKINDLYDKGNKIIYMTARGMGRHNNNPLAAIQDCEKYCGKLLYFVKDKKCSWHYHKIKDEVFYVQSGKILVKYSENDDLDKAEEIVLGPGDNFHVYIGLRHQMIAIEDTELYEFSTQHFDEDSYRIIKGD